MKKPDFLYVEVGVVKSGCVHSFGRTLKLAVCQGEMNGIN